MANAVPRSATMALRLLMRRLGVVVVLLVVSYSAVRALVEYFGGDDGDVDAGSFVVDGQPDDVTVESVIDGSAPTDSVDEAALAATTPPVAEQSDVEEPTTESSAPEPEITGPPGPSNKAKVYIVGDSDAGTFGPFLQKLLDGTTVVDTTLNYKVSSGLARPDFYNWPVQLESALPDADPDIVVATFGGNDAQGLRNLDLSWVVQDPVSNAEAWVEEYTQRAGNIMDLLLQDNRTLIWVGIPNDDNPDVTARLELQDRAAKAAAAARPSVIFIDTWDRFSGRDGGWAEFVIDPRDGVGKDVRADDGFHLNTNGAEILALDIAQAVRDDLRARGANI